MNATAAAAGMNKTAGMNATTAAWNEQDCWNECYYCCLE